MSAIQVNPAEHDSPVAGDGRVIAFTIEELSVGGAERMLVAMANEFAQLGWVVHVVCLTRAGDMAGDLDAAIQVHVLNKRPGLDINIALKINRCIRKIDPVVVNSHLWVANAWTRIGLYYSRKVLVATEHSRDSWKPWYYRLADRLLARRTAALVSVSSDTAEFYRDIIGLENSPVSVINNGVDTQRYSAGDGSALRFQWLGTATLSQAPVDKQIVIGTVGRLVLAKNHRRLLDMLVLLRQDPQLREYQIKLVIVGGGPEREAIQSYISELGQQEVVVMAGERHDIPDVLAAFDLFVLSSDREGHPLTALEAQAAGTPVVLTNAGGSEEAIARQGEQSGGVLVDKRADALAKPVREMILSPALRTERAEFGQRYALQNFDKKHMIERYAALFETVIV